MKPEHRSSSSPPSAQQPAPAYRDIARALLHHAWPVLVAQVLAMGMMIADTIITGHYSTADLAGVAVGNGLYVSVVMLLVGILQAVAPTIAHHVGAGRIRQIAPSLHQGFWLALMLALPGCALLAWPQALLDFARVPPDIAAGAGSYLQATAFGLPAALFYRTFSAFNNAIGRPRVLMMLSLLALSLHIPLAWALTHGSFSAFGLPALGGVGCGISSSIVSWIGVSCAFFYLQRGKAYQPYQLFARLHPPRIRELAALMRLGLPMGLSTFIEITSFTLVALFAARLGSEAVAGHRIIANLSALTYMLPLAMSIATLVLVGQAAGARDWARATATVKVSLVLSAALAVAVGAVLWLLRAPVIGLSTSDPAVQAVALSLVVYVCVYQLTDSIQTVAAHALRGYKITLLPMVLHTLSFWGIGLAGGYWASYHAFGRELAPSIAGFWQASVVATVLASLLFGWLLRRVIRSQQAGD